MDRIILITLWGLWEDEIRSLSTKGELSLLLLFYYYYYCCCCKAPLKEGTVRTTQRVKDHIRAGMHSGLLFSLLRVTLSLAVCFGLCSISGGPWNVISGSMSCFCIVPRAFTSAVMRTSQGSFNQGECCGLRKRCF